MGIAPIGRQITVAGVIVDRVSGDKIEAEWAYYDVMRLRQHLGPPRCNRSSHLPPDGMGRLPHDVRESMLPWYAGAETLGAMPGGGAG